MKLPLKTEQWKGLRVGKFYEPKSLNTRHVRESARYCMLVSIEVGHATLPTDSGSERIDRYQFIIGEKVRIFDYSSCQFPTEDWSQAT